MESSDIKKLENISGLRLLRSICRLGTLSAAAEEQKLSISAASHQLAVMKDFFKDELFQRSGRGLIPNRRMGDLLPRIILVLDGLDALNEEESFDPGKVKRQMRILCYGVGYFTFILPILSELFAEAPGLHLSINFYPKEGKAVEFLKNGFADFGLNPIPPTVQGIRIHPLTTLKYVLLLSSTHPIYRRWKEPNRFQLNWLLPYTQFIPSSSKIGYYRSWLQLAERGMRTIESPFFHTNSFYIEGSNAVGWIPEPSGRYLEANSGGRLGVIPLPGEKKGEFVPKLFWHERLENGPLHQWVRSKIISHASSMDLSKPLL